MPENCYKNKRNIRPYIRHIHLKWFWPTLVVSNNYNVGMSTLKYGIVHNYVPQAVGGVQQSDPKSNNPTHANSQAQEYARARTTGALHRALNRSSKVSIKHASAHNTGALHQAI